MNKNRLFPLLILLLTNFHFIVPEKGLVRASEYNTEAKNLIISQTLTFEEHLKAGYQELEKQNYQQALFNFNSALKLRPNNPEAQQAVTRTKGYIYDYNMEKGYEATNNKQYDQALTYFRFASEQRPDDFYSQQAIKNVQKLKEKQNSSGTFGISPFAGQNRLSILLMFIFLLLVLIIIALISIAWRLAQLNNPDEDKKGQRRKLQQPPIRKTTNLDSPDSNIDTSSLSPIDNSPISELENPTNSQLASQPSNQKDLVQQPYQPIAITEDKTQRLLTDLKQANSIQRSKIVWNLATQADSRAVQPLMDLLMTANSQEKSLIIEALSQIGFNSLKPINQALMIALQDQHGQVRKNALRDITKLYELMLQVQPIIAHATLNDPDNEVRQTARWALTKLTSENNILMSGENKNQDYEQEINATLIEDESEEKN